MGDSLAAATRQRWPHDKLLDLAESLAASEDEGIRMRALEWLTDRGYGKVPTDTRTEIALAPSEERPFANLSTDELRARIAAAKLALPPTDDESGG